MGSIEHIDKAYFQVAKPSAGGSIPAGKSDTAEDALGKPGRFTRSAVTTATPRPDSKQEEVIFEQVGTNAELVWHRFGKDKPSPKTGQDFKKNFNNPTDNPSDVKVK